MNKKFNSPLSAAQQEIMEIVWGHDEITVTEVQHRLLELGRNLARNTVQTLIVRMEEKGWLVHRTVGRTFFYSAAQPKNVSLGNEVKQLLENSFQGSAEQLVNSLLENYSLKKGEAERIRKILDAADKNRNKRR